jgi:hypothetical protein
MQMEVTTTATLSFPVLGLEELDDLGVHLEALCQDGVWYLRLGPEERGHDAGQLAVEHGHAPTLYWKCMRPRGTTKLSPSRTTLL